MIQIELAQTAEHISVARALFIEYEEAIGVDLEFQGFAAELAGLPSPYSRPDGGLFIARIEANVAGCVAFKRLDGSAAEMKRLYVRPGYRGNALGGRLVDTVVSACRQVGYDTLRLDTLPTMVSAQALYRKLGFEEIPPYGESYLPGTQFYELTL